MRARRAHDGMQMHTEPLDHRSPEPLYRQLAQRFESLIERFGVPYYMKVDIEGADLLCLQGLARAHSRPKYVSIESDKRRWSRLRQEFSLLRELGYDRFKIVQQREVMQQRCPQPAREG